MAKRFTDTDKWRKERLRELYNTNRVGQNWYRFGLTSIYSLPDLPCCYVIYGDGKVVYVGSTMNLRKRFSNGGHKITYLSTSIGKKVIELHRTAWGEFTDLHMKVRFPEFIGDWAWKEIYLIHKLRPSGNMTYNW